METTEYSESLKYRAVQSDYDLLLDFLEKPESSTADFEKTSIIPSAHSPLLQFSAPGRALLQPLLTDPGYRAHCLKSGNDPDTLELTVKDDTVTYEIRSTDKKRKSNFRPPLQQKWEHDSKGKLALVVSAPKWVSLMTAIAPEAKKIGGTIYANGAVSLVQMTNYYGILPWHAGIAEEHRTTINALEEKRARHSLRLDSRLDIDLLNRAPTKADRRLLKTLNRRNSVIPMTMDALITQLTEREINDIVNNFLASTNTSLFTHLEKTTLPRPTVEQARATPTVFLEKILRSAESVRLSDALLKGLQWYGAGPLENTSSEIRIKLVSRAIRLYSGLTRENKPEDIAGYPWHQRSNWGKSYQTIWAEFEQHLRDTDRASSVTESILLARLFQPEFPREFQIPDIPPDLPYRSSAVWVNFVHGVTLADAMEPDLIQRMSFQQLVEFPLQQSMQATSQELELIAMARMPPTLEWAITSGVILERSDSDYSPQDKAQSIKSLDEHMDALKKAIIQLDVSYPERKVIAEREIKKYFKHALRRNGEGKLVKPIHSKSSVFISDGRKLIEDFGGIDGGGLLQGPPLKDKAYTFLDVYMSGGLTPKRTWFITMNDGIGKTPHRIGINNDRTIKTTAPWLPATVTQNPLPDVEKLFESDFNNYLELSKNAYQALLKSLFSSLPHNDRLGIERGEVKIYTLRKSTDEIAFDEEKPDHTLPLRLRMGFVLKITYQTNVAYYECFPRAGIIRKRTDILSTMLNGEYQAQQVKGPIYAEANVIKVIRGKSVPFDWEAHERGTPPKEKATCTAIIDQFGKTFTTSSLSPDLERTSHPAAAFSRSSELAHYIAHHFFFFDEKMLRKAAQGETEIEHEAARPHWLDKVKGFIPFWGGISDLLSGDPRKRIWAVFGLIVDVASFAFPLGKFVSGSMKLVSASVRSGVRVALPEFGSLFQKLTVSLVQNTIPFYGLPTLGFRLGRGSIKGLYTGLHGVLSPAYKSIRTAVGRVGSHSFINGFAHMDNPASWRPLVAGDQLASLRGMHDIPVRNIASAGKADFRLVDPISSRPYGPLLSHAAGELSLGRSHYNALEKHNSHILVEVAENTRVREVLEVDGRTTVFLDDVPYRLDGDTLRRVSSLEDSEKLKQIPCRIRRGLDDVCKFEYVLSDSPAERPSAGTVIEEKKWAEWFGDRTFYPSTAKSANDRRLLAYEEKIYELKDGKLNTYKGKPEWIGLDQKIPVPRAKVSATLEFQTGIYGSLKVIGTAKKIDDVHIVGAIILPSIEGKSKYVFTRLNFNDYYIATLSAGDSILAPLTMRKLSTAELVVGTAGEELHRAYVGSLNANNTARIHGIEKLERALQKMNEIAIPIGSPKNPSENMKWIKVDTNSTEALMFDQKTRLMVAELPDGAAIWKPSTQTPEELQKSTAATFDTLFSDPASATPSGSRTNVVNIDQAMEQLQKHLPSGQSSERLRNIAYAKVRTATGRDEVYVSVSGVGDNTRHLPLFQSNNHLPEVNINETFYINIDKFTTLSAPTSLRLSDDGKLLAIPHPINVASDVDQINRVTSADSESKLVGFINEKYPNAEDIRSITVVTTLPPCDSCSIVMKEFGHERGASALNVIWGKRPDLRKRPHPDSSSGSSGSSGSGSPQSSSANSD
jgi:hypothetical protein